MISLRQFTFTQISDVQIATCLNPSFATLFAAFAQSPTVNHPRNEVTPQIRSKQEVCGSTISTGIHDCPFRAIGGVFS